jgi:hypothetical protein
MARPRQQRPAEPAHRRHCDDGGGVNYFNKTRGFQAVGWFTHQAYEGDDSEDDDVALLGIANSPNGPPQVATDTRIIGIRPVTAPADDAHLAKGQQLCHYGLITGPQHGGPECGPITDVGPAKVKFLAPVEKGDSGGPVYYRNHRHPGRHHHSRSRRRRWHRCRTDRPMAGALEPERR